MQIGIIGLGYVGLPLAVAFAEAGCEVVGLDVDASKVEALNSGRSYIEDVPGASLAPLGERLPACRVGWRRYVASHRSARPAGISTLGARSGRRKAMTMTVRERRAAIISPGTNPAMNNAPIEVSAMTP